MHNIFQKSFSFPVSKYLLSNNKNLEVKSKDMAAIRNFDDNNNNNNYDPYSSNNDSNNSSNGKDFKNGKYIVLIVGVGLIATVGTMFFWYQEMQLDAEVTEAIDNFLFAWKDTNGDKGYEAISSIVLTSEFKDKTKKAIKDSKSDADKRNNLARVYSSIMPEYLQRVAMYESDLSNLERGMLMLFSNSFEGLNND